MEYLEHDHAFRNLMSSQEINKRICAILKVWVIVKLCSMSMIKNYKLTSWTGPHHGKSIGDLLSSSNVQTISIVRWLGNLKLMFSHSSNCVCENSFSPYYFPWILNAIFFHSETPLAADLKNTPCAPNDYFQIDCNTCYCNTERSGYLCTENIACHKEAESSTTKQITISKDALLFISDHQVQLVKDYNSNDNAISRIVESGGNGDEKSHQTTTVHGVKVAHISEVNKSYK